MAAFAQAGAGRGTHAESPVILRGWLAPGTHVTSVGFNSAGAGEVDAETVRDALVVVESRAAALAPPPAGAVELLRAIAAGTIDEAHVHAELGELVADTTPGRTSDEQLTLYKSVGVAVQDAAAAALVLTRAGAGHAGIDVTL
jgi:ornithine cyclodeaminase